MSNSNDKKPSMSNGKSPDELFIKRRKMPNATHRTPNKKALSADDAKGTTARTTRTIRSAEEQLSKGNRSMKKTQRISPVFSKRRTKSTGSKSRKSEAIRKIIRFMKKFETKRKARFLNSVCSDSGVCIAFGREDVAIKKFFDNFNNFKLLSGPAKKIAIEEESSNGFITELAYEKEGYKANAILKSNLDDRTDNLLYEGLVGQFLNKKAKIFPCFVETYGIYRHNPDSYSEMKDSRETLASVLTQLRQIKHVTDVDIEESCEFPTLTCILIQHLKLAVTLENAMDGIKGIKAEDFIKNDLLYVLFQIYIPLSIISDEFTHYDLHAGNVLLYKPVKDSYIEYHYHFENNVVSFKSKYIAKVIDYGHSYFNDTNETDNSITANSNNIYNAVCTAKEHCKDCGKKQGYKWLTVDKNDKNDKNFVKYGYVSTRFLNKSHDLRLLNFLYKYFKDILNKHNPVLHFLFENLQFDRENDGIYETPTPGYHPGTGLDPDTGVINCVEDVMTYLIEKVKMAAIVNSNNDSYSSLKKLGDLHVYAQGNRPMRYVPVELTTAESSSEL